jgi:hypothetical protein
MRHLMCMRTPVRFGVRDGAIDVTSAAVGKVSDCPLRVIADIPTFQAMSALPPKTDISGGDQNVCFVPEADMRFARVAADICAKARALPEPAKVASSRGQHLKKT